MARKKGQNLNLAKSSAKIRREAVLCRRKFWYFVLKAWSHIPPFTPCDWGWHLSVICEVMQAVAEDRVQELIINIPPGHAKSIIVSVAYPAWRWLRDPNWGGMFGCNTQELAKRDGSRTRDLVNGQWYQGVAKELVLAGELKQRPRLVEANEKLLRLDTGGQRIAVSVGGGGTGKRADDVIIDDPMEAADALSQAARDRAWRWVSGTMRSRRNDLRTGSFIMMMQRLHEDDPSGRMEKAEDVQKLALASEYNPDRPSVVYAKDGSEVARDPRTKDGELLFPERFPQEALDKEKGDGGMGPSNYAAQHQQDPERASGQIWKAHWWRYWYHPSSPPPMHDLNVGGVTIRPTQWVPLPEKFEYLWQSWDLTLGSEKEKSSWCCGLQLGKVGANRFVLEEERGKWGIQGSIDAMMRLHRKWPSTNVKYIEAKALGAPVMKVVVDTIPGMVGVTPKGSKETRMRAEQGTIAGGNVILPDPRSDRTVSEFVRECSNAPKEPNDRADTLSQALLMERDRKEPDVHVGLITW